MRIWWKQSNVLLLFSLSIFFIIPTVVTADEDGGGKGKLQIKTDRIIENNREEDADIVESELDKSFPELFQEETKEKIELQQKEMEKATNDLKRDVFHEEMSEMTTLYEVKNELFTENYTSPKVFATEDTDEPSTNTLSSIIYYGSFVGFIGLIGSGILMILRRWE